MHDHVVSEITSILHQFHSVLRFHARGFGAQRNVRALAGASLQSGLSWNSKRHRIFHGTPCLKEYFSTIKINQTQSNAAATRTSLKADFTQNYAACEKREEKKHESTVRVTVKWAPSLSICCKYGAISAFWEHHSIWLDFQIQEAQIWVYGMVWNIWSSCSERGDWHYHQCTYLLTYNLDLIFLRLPSSSPRLSLESYHI